MNKEIIEKIRKKRELSQIPEKDIKLAYKKFEKRQISEDEKINLTRELLRKTFSAFVSKKLLSLKDKKPEWILRKHISTRERLPYYEEVYSRLFENYKKFSLVDLGAGINGLSYRFFPKNRKISYFGIEAVGQLVELMNFYFEKEKIDGKAVHESLFEKEKIIEFVQKQKSPRIIFLFKVIDALESLERNYSKELILELAKNSDLIVLSFATKSLGKRKNFFAKRNWIINFIKDNFQIVDDFEIGGERYISFKK